MTSHTLFLKNNNTLDVLCKGNQGLSRPQMTRLSPSKGKLYKTILVALDQENR